VRTGLATHRTSFLHAGSNRAYSVFAAKEETELCTEFTAVHVLRRPHRDTSLARVVTHQIKWMRSKADAISSETVEGDGKPNPKASKWVQEVKLEPLAHEHAGQLIADALRCEPKRAVPLAHLLHN
jgi:hypothetical protein